MTLPQWHSLIDSKKYLIAHEFGDEVTAHVWPNDIPADKDGINVDNGGRIERTIATSTRAIVVGRETYKGRPLKGRLGFVCAENVRPDKFTGRIPTKYVFGGGKLQDDFDTRDGGEYVIEETVRRCVAREVKEEIGIEFAPENFFLFGLRTITEGQSNEPKMERGHTAVDALYFALCERPLGYFEGKRTEDSRGVKERETGERQVRSAAELLYELSADERRRGEKPPLFRSQAAALAIGIIALDDLLGSELTGEWKTLIEESVPFARRFLDNSRRLDLTTTRTIQQRPWKP